MKKLKKLIPVCVAFTMLFIFSGCSSEDETESKKKNNDVNNAVLNVEENSVMEDYNMDMSDVKNPIVTMKVQYVDASGEKKDGTIKMELYPQAAPITVANFVNLVNNKFYDGLTFHRIMDNFMIQGGDPAGNGTGGATVSDLNKSVEKGSKNDFEYSIKGEFSANKFNNTTKFEAGTLAMARSDYSFVGLAEDGYNSACSQFFIMNTDNENTNAYLQGQYAAFGKVIEGYDVVRAISGTKVKNNGNSGENSTPVEAPVIKSVEVETYGTDYKVPNVINAEEVSQKVQDAYNKLYNRNN